MFGDSITRRDVKSFAGERGGDFGASETFGEQSLFAGVKDRATDAAARPIGMNEERANAGRVAQWIDVRIGFVAAGAGTALGFALAPAAARDDFSRSGFGDEVGLVFDELTIDAENGSDGGFALGLRCND